MSKFRNILLILLFWLTTVQAQDRYVLDDSAGTWLNNVDQDTIYMLLPTGVLPRHIGSDTTKASVTKFTPSTFVRSSGYFDLWLDRVNAAGAADSLRCYYFPLHPVTGVLSKNDSTFILGGASTFASFTSGSNYALTVPAGKGVGIVIRQGDLTAVRTRVVAHLLYTQ